MASFSLAASVAAERETGDFDIIGNSVDALGALYWNPAAIGRLDFVTHCYERPRRLPDWPYNLFAMVHAGDRATVLARVGEIATLLGPACRGHDVLFSSEILKKTGLRIGGDG